MVDTYKRLASVERDFRADPPDERAALAVTEPLVESLGDHVVAPDDGWMRTTEVAEELGVDPETVRRLIRARRLRATVLMGGGRPTFRIRRSDFERFRTAYTRDSLVDDWE